MQIRGGENQPDFAMKIEVREGIPQWVEVQLQARPDGPEVRDKDLAVIRLGDWLEQIVAMCSLKYSGTGPGWTSWSKPVDDRTAVPDIRRALSGRPRTVTPERLQQVAEIYRQHFERRPTEAVARSFGVSHRTAARYVQQARWHGSYPNQAGQEEELNLMSKRQQLPPQIKKIRVTDRSTGKTVVRYQLTVDAGLDPESGRRRQIRRRLATEAAARAELA